MNNTKERKSSSALEYADRETSREEAQEPVVRASLINQSQSR